MKKIILLISGVLASVLAKAQVLAIGDTQFAVRTSDKSLSGRGTSTCLANNQIAGHGTSTCLADSRAGMGTSTCLSRSNWRQFDHPKLLTDQQVLDLLKQVSTDDDRLKIIEMLRENSTKEN